MTEEQLAICKSELSRVTREHVRIMFSARYDGESMWLTQEKWDELDRLHDKMAFLSNEIYGW